MRSLVFLFIFAIFNLEAQASISVLYVHAEDTSVVDTYKNSEDLEVITTESGRLPRASTGDIVKFLRESQSPRKLVCHGKAAADCLEALILHPELREKVAKWVLLDGYILGAPGSEKAVDPLPLAEVKKAEKMPLILALRFVFDTFLQFFHGFDRTLYHFRPDQRRLYLEANKGEILEIAHSVEIESQDQTSKGYGRFPFSLENPMAHAVSK